MGSLSVLNLATIDPIKQLPARNPYKIKSSVKEQNDKNLDNNHTRMEVKIPKSCTIKTLAVSLYFINLFLPSIFL